MVDASPSLAPEVDPELITGSDVAQLLSISAATLYRLAASGKLPRSVRLGRITRYRRSEVLAWIEAGCPSRQEWEQRADFTRRLKSLSPKK